MSDFIRYAITEQELEREIFDAAALVRLLDDELAGEDNAAEREAIAAERTDAAATLATLEQQLRDFDRDDPPTRRVPRTCATTEERERAAQYAAARERERPYGSRF